MIILINITKRSIAFETTLKYNRKLYLGSNVNGKCIMGKFVQKWIYAVELCFDWLTGLIRKEMNKTDVIVLISCV